LHSITKVSKRGQAIASSGKNVLKTLVAWKKLH